MAPDLLSHLLVRHLSLKAIWIWLKLNSSSIPTIRPDIYSELHISWIQVTRSSFFTPHPKKSQSIIVLIYVSIACGDSLLYAEYIAWNIMTLQWVSPKCIKECSRWLFQFHWPTLNQLLTFFLTVFSFVLFLKVFHTFFPEWFYENK